MKQYNISLTITDEDNNEQLVQLRAPHLTGKQVHDLAELTLAGILVEPGPEVMIIHKPETSRKKKRHMFSRKPIEIAEKPDGFTPKDLKV